MNTYTKNFLKCVMCILFSDIPSTKSNINPTIWGNPTEISNVVNSDKYTMEHAVYSVYITLLFYFSIT